jgi:hypothetical protein
MDTLITVEYHLTLSYAMDTVQFFLQLYLLTVVRRVWYDKQQILRGDAGDKLLFVLTTCLLHVMG